ncbi:MAG: exodeoxyribonuclease VII small subunit [Ruminococcaceae bacterium]|nr:exodeoxyribonuclease VII small subunit [Oscillospiraceae bacterium]
MMSGKTKNIEKYDLEAAMKRLDEVVALMSRENVSLEESLALYEEGVALVRHCNEKLDVAQRKINELKMTDDGEIVAEPFDASGIGE